jgi:DNA-binding protein WhiA
MSFAEVIKKEILDKPIKDHHCKLAFLAGIIRGTGVLFEKDDQVGIDFKVPNEECAFAVTMLLKSLFNYDVREVAVSENSLSKKDKFVISLYGKGTVNILKSLEILKEEKGELTVNFLLFSDLTQKECCLKSFIRGLFLTTGNCTIPKEGTKHTNTGYHLELSFSHSSPAQATANKLAKFHIYPKILRRKGSFVLYLKSAEEIKDFIAFLPAPISVLKITDTIINKELSNNSNRQKNCDLGNLNRQIEAVAKQIEAITKIQQIKGLSFLKPQLEEVALARKENPEETLLELATRLNISKSCLNHRLRKIVCIANELEEQ